MCKYWLGEEIEQSIDRVAPVLASKKSKTEVTVIDHAPDAKVFIHHIDVGQGEATLIEYFYAELRVMTILIDGGLATRGGGTVIRYLKNLGVTTLDGVICSHYDGDHIGGLIRVLEFAAIESSFLQVKNTFERGEDTDEYPQTVTLFRRAADECGNRFTLKLGESIGCVLEQGRPLLKITCVCVNNSQVLDSEENNASIGLLLQLGNFQYFTGGDLESLEEERGVREHVCAFKCGHHGSNHSTSTDFLKTASPSSAFISCGHQNYGHPGEYTIERLQKAPSVHNFYLTTCHYNRIGVNDLWMIDEMAIASQMMSNALYNLDELEQIFLQDANIESWCKLTFSLLQFMQIHSYWDPLLKRALEMEDIIDSIDASIMDICKSTLQKVAVFYGVKGGPDQVARIEKLILDYCEAGPSSPQVVAMEEGDGDQEEAEEEALKIPQAEDSEAEQSRTLALEKMRVLRKEVRLSAGKICRNVLDTWCEQARRSGSHLFVTQRHYYSEVHESEKGIVAGDSSHLGMIVLGATLAGNGGESHEHFVKYHCMEPCGMKIRRHRCGVAAQEVGLREWPGTVPQVTLVELGGELRELELVCSNMDEAQAISLVPSATPSMHMLKLQEDEECGTASEHELWLTAVKKERAYQRFREPSWLRAEPEQPNPLSQWEYDDRMGLHDSVEMLPSKDRTYAEEQEACTLCSSALGRFDDGVATCGQCKKKYRVHVNCWHYIKPKKAWKCAQCQ